MSQETYSVAALAVSVGVPRTTINDWLVRYEDYIDSVQMGKRKVYSAQSLAVLKTIAVLRDEGKSSAEIEAALASEHGVKPEVAEDIPVQDSPVEAKAENETAGTSDEENAPLLPAVKEFEKSAVELTGFIAELRNQHRRAVRRSRWVIALMVIAIAVLLAVSFMAYKFMQAQLNSQKTQSERLAANMQKMHLDFTAQMQAQAAASAEERKLAAEMQAKLLAEAAAESNRLRDELLKMHEERTALVNSLQKQLEAERKAFAETMARRESELLQRSEVERKQLLLQMQADAKRSEIRLNELQKELETASRSLGELNDNLQQLKSQQAAEAPAAGANTPAPEAAGVTDLPGTDNL